MPSYISHILNIVIAILGLFDLLLDTDIFADAIAVLVEKQQCQKAAHSAVAIINRMDAEENRQKSKRLGSERRCFPLPGLAHTPHTLHPSPSEYQTGILVWSR